MKAASQNELVNLFKAFYDISGENKLSQSQLLRLVQILILTLIITKPTQVLQLPFLVEQTS